MLEAASLKMGSVIRREGELFRVLEVAHHGGSGQFAGFIALKLKSLRTGHVKEIRLASDEKVEDVELTRRDLEYLYEDEESFVFMDSETYEQYNLPKDVLGKKSVFLTPNARLPVEFWEEQPVNVIFPEVVELKVASAPPGLRDMETSTYKTAVLENGMEVLVPQFIETGDTVRIETETGKYLERVRQKK
ncbi:MAG: elongation factor P [Thermoanaerobaculum sp.]|jgi:elongation factor P|uniref:Elongation factor P n=1 Tax=Thermoanaerobaculum aquaticum TaxID=1312852 RepID=A0A7V1ZIJ1_9BACT|nr:MAG: elongation factor P [Thermoanaerobaculum sp.]GBC79692.1 Elongation factor P [bacterium HR09]